MASLPLTLFENVRTIDREILGEQTDDACKPFGFTETGVSLVAMPGQRNGMYVATGLEHDEHGHPNYSPDMHQKMTEKRHKRLDLVFQVHKGFELFKPDEDESFEIGIISWGSTEGPLREALESLSKENINIPLMQLKLLNPLPRKPLLQFIEMVDKIIVPEHNYLGQLAGMIEALTAKPVIRLNKVAGLPFDPSELVDFIQKHIRVVPAYHEAV
jgi:2-oxoglutarate ferredoxin oxidoreductase subunit alpha